MAQRDTLTRELLDMLGHRSIQKLLVVPNAAQQGETIEDVLISYRRKPVPRRDPVQDGRGR